MPRTCKKQSRNNNGAFFIFLFEDITMGRLFAFARKTLGITALALLLGATSCLAAEEPSEPINIEANRMVSQENANSVVFIGNVDARQGKLTIRADEMTVYYTEKKNNQDKTDKTSSQMEKLNCKNYWFRMCLPGAAFLAV